MTAPTNQSSTPAQSWTMTTLAIDLGKFKSVACRFDPATDAQAFEKQIAAG
jgi:hypothetical protein